MIDSIPCPNCNAPITIPIKDFLDGKTFSCTECNSKIGLAEETDISKDHLNQLKEFQNLQNKKSQNALPCPDCGFIISFKPKELLNGKPITCLNCKAKISLEG